MSTGGGGLVAKSCLNSWDLIDCTVVCQAPLSMGFPRQKYWIWSVYPSPGDLPDPGVEPIFLLHCRWILYHWATTEDPICWLYLNKTGKILMYLLNKICAYMHIYYQQAGFYIDNKIMAINSINNLSISHSIMSNSLQPHGLWPARLSCPWTFQARIMEWVDIPFSRASSQPRNRTWVSCTAGRFFTSWTSTEARSSSSSSSINSLFVISLSWTATLNFIGFCCLGIFYYHKNNYCNI